MYVLSRIPINFSSPLPSALAAAAAVVAAAPSVVQCASLILATSQLKSSEYANFTRARMLSIGGCAVSGTLVLCRGEEGGTDERQAKSGRERAVISERARNTTDGWMDYGRRLQ